MEDLKDLRRQLKENPESRELNNRYAQIDSGELLLKQLEDKVPGTVADDYKLYQQWGVDVRFVQPGLCGWEGSSVILESGKRHLDKVNSLQHGTGPLDRLRIALAPKKRITNAKNALEATLDEVKHRFSR